MILAVDIGNSNIVIGCCDNSKIMFIERLSTKHSDTELEYAIAFKNVLKDDADNIYREEILYYIAMSSYKYAHESVPAKQKERYLSFVDDYLNFVGELPESHYRKELDVVYQRAQKALGRHGVTDVDEEMTEKDFAKERRKLLREAKKSETSEK